MTRMGSNYDISRATGVCASTGEEIAAGDACIACLCERASDDGFDRVDYSLTAWDAGARPERLFSYWRTTVPERNAKRRIFVDDDALLAFFERLAGDDRPQRIAFRFVIALVLMRKKLLKFERTRTEDDIEYWDLRRRTRADEPDAPVESIINPKLTDEDVHTVSNQLGEILDGDLE